MELTKLVEIIPFEFYYYDLEFDEDGNYTKLSSDIYPGVRENDDSLAIVFKEDSGEIVNLFSFNNKDKQNRDNWKILDKSMVHLLDLQAMYEDVFCRYRYGEEKYSKEVIDYLFNRGKINQGYYKYLLEKIDE